MTDGFKDEIIFTPVFAGTRYKHHACSECGYEIILEQSVYGGVYFPYGKEGFRFCPGCGRPVIRFGNTPIFEEEIDYEPLRPFWDLCEEYERKCQWMYHLHIQEEQREKVNELLAFAQSSTGWVKKAYNAVALAKKYDMNWRKLKKLQDEFGEANHGK